MALVFTGACRDDSDDDDKPDGGGGHGTATQTGITTTETPVDTGSAERAPDILVDPLSIDFGIAGPEGSLPEEVLIVNTGEADLTLSAFASSLPDFRVNTASPLVLAPDTTARIEVVFEPSVNGPIDASLTLFSDDPDEPEVVVLLQGEGAVDGLVASPSAVDFVDAAVGCPEQEVLVLTNLGDDDLQLDRAVIDGPFAIVDAPELPYTLPPDDDVQVTIQWVPEAVNSPVSGTLEVGTAEGDLLVIPLSGDATTAVQPQTEAVTLDLPAVDVLVALDTSCSMESEQAGNVAVAFPSLVEALDASTDWRLALVNDEDACSPGVLDPTTPYAAQLLVAAAFDVNNGFPQGNYLVEQLLTLSAIALEQTGPKECNGGLRRDDTPLWLLLVSDEEEQTPNASVPQLVNQLNTYVDDPDDLVISTVVAVNGTCGDGSGADRYVQAANLTGGFVLDICGQWGPDFQDAIADQVAAPRVRSFTLPKSADPTTVSVTVNGTAAVDVSVDGDVVTVHDPLLSDDDDVEVTYLGPGECD